MEPVLIESVKRPGVTRSVAPHFADILVKLGLYRRKEVAPAVTETPRPRVRRSRATDPDSPAPRPRTRRKKPED